MLGSTLERVVLPDDLVARLEGKSSLGRLGLLIHSTAGFIDPGWDGHVTLELSNVANLPITIYPGMKIGQLSFVQLAEPAEHPYGSGGLGSKYQGQRGPTPSRYWKNFEPTDDPRHRRDRLRGGRSSARSRRRGRDAVRGAVRGESSSAGLRARRPGDMTDAASLRAAADGCRTVVHLVAIPPASRTTSARDGRRGRATSRARASRRERFVS